MFAVLNILEKNPEKVLIVMDGFDELRGSDTIQSILKKNVYQKVKVMVTTRPHGLTLIRQLGSQSIDQLARILGFSKPQIQAYINQFYELNNAPKGGDVVLYDKLSNERKDLFRMASIPIRLEMICVVWNATGELGKTVTDIYIKFIQYLLDHMEKKCDKNPRSSETAIMNIYEDLLMNLGCLAFSWNKHNVLVTVFDYEEMKKVYENRLPDMINLGCLVKYHPSHALEKSSWSFTHLTFQEYFLAFYLSNT